MSKPVKITVLLEVGDDEDDEDLLDLIENFLLEEDMNVTNIYAEESE